MRDVLRQPLTGDVFNEDLIGSRVVDRRLLIMREVFG
jgi:hypothetical protein